MNVRGGSTYSGSFETASIDHSYYNSFKFQKKCLNRVEKLLVKDILETYIMPIVAV